MNDQQLTLIKDSREPDAAWDRYFSAPTVTQCLKTGDYSIQGYEDLVAIERKTIDDLVGCLTKGRERFTRELERAKSLEFFCVILEASFSALVNGEYISRLHPTSALESISAWEIRYGHPFYFCGSAQLAARKCESLLRKYHREKLKTAALVDDLPF
jgi:DNA excision repair protein ERCC-4